MSTEPAPDITDRLRATPDRKARAQMVGLIREPGEVDGEKRACDTCIYFLTHHAWCDVPELDFPVDADWFCDLWRV